MSHINKCIAKRTQFCWLYHQWLNIIFNINFSKVINMLLLMVLKENCNILEGVVSLPISKKRVPYILFTSSMVGQFFFLWIVIWFFFYLWIVIWFFFICELWFKMLGSFHVHVHKIFLKFECDLWSKSWIKCDSWSILFRLKNFQLLFWKHMYCSQTAVVTGRFWFDQ